MPQFVVSTRGSAPVTVEAGNWITALGLGLDRLGTADSLDRLACEVLPNGTVIARDARSGSGFVVQPMGTRVEPRVSVQGDDEHTVLMMEPDPEDALLAAPDEDETVVLRGTATGELVDRIARAPSDMLAWQTALEVSQVLVPSEAGAALRAEGTGSLRFVGASGPHARQLLAMALPGGTGVVGFCVDRSTSLVVRNPYSDPRFYRGVDLATGFTTRAILCAPVRTKAGAIGCLELLNPVNRQAFDRVSLDLVEQVAVALAQRLAVKNGRRGPLPTGPSPS